MAVGFPVKDDYATGDVLTAANMNDFAGTLNTVPTFAGNVNPVLNSAFQLWQRGTTLTPTFASVRTFLADRWEAQCAGNDGTTYSRQLTGDTTNLPNIQYCFRFQRNSGVTATNGNFLIQNIETVNSIPFAGKTVTLSFYARKGANYSSASSALSATLASGTGTDQNWATGFTSSTNVILQTATLTTTWQRFSYTGTIGATATQLAILFRWTGSGTAGAADFYEVTGVQLDVGSTALPFRTYAGTIQGELAACQRYYQKSLPQGTAPAANAGRTGAVENYAIRAAAATGISAVRLPVLMRAAPTVTIYNPSAAGNQARNLDTGTDCTSTTVEAQADSSFRYFYTLPASTVSTNLISANYEASAEL
jgi:hypothetical protein